MLTSSGLTIRANGLNRARHALISGGFRCKTAFFRPFSGVACSFMGEDMENRDARRGARKGTKKREGPEPLRVPSLPYCGRCGFIPYLMTGLMLLRTASRR